MEPNREDRWIAERLATLEPKWRADFAHGSRLLDAGLARRTHSWPRLAIAAAAVLCIAAFAMPQTRAFAQQLWLRLMVNRVDVVRLDLSDFPLRARITTNGLQQTAASLDDAERQAGFRPQLPPAGTLPGEPKLSTLGTISLEQTIQVEPLQAALKKVGAVDAQVPREWEGLQLRTEIGPMVTADYPDDLQILQVPPMEISMPPGFPLERFAELAFRSLGVTVWESRALAQKFVANPAWLLDIPPDEVVNIQEVQVANGKGLLIEDFDDHGKLERVTVIHSTRERIFAVIAKTRDAALKVARTLP